MSTKKQSAGLLLYRRVDDSLQLLLVHPGGPFWMKKDAGAWSIPKGEYADGEAPLAAARREFAEETGFVVDGPFLELGTVMQRGGKRVCAWAVEGDADPTQLRSNTFRMEWPPKSGKQQDFPEVDRAAWFDVGTARQKLLPAQIEFIDALIARLDRTPPL